MQQTRREITAYVRRRQLSVIFYTCLLHPLLFSTILSEKEATTAYDGGMTVVSDSIVAACLWQMGAICIHICTPCLLVLRLPAFVADGVSISGYQTRFIRDVSSCGGRRALTPLCSLCLTCLVAARSAVAAAQVPVPFCLACCLLRDAAF
jgi:hypothetical protein